MGICILLHRCDLGRESMGRNALERRLTHLKYMGICKGTCEEIEHRWGSGVLDSTGRRGFANDMRNTRRNAQGTNVRRHEEKQQGTHIEAGD